MIDDRSSGGRTTLFCSTVSPGTGRVPQFGMNDTCVTARGTSGTFPFCPGGESYRTFKGCVPFSSIFRLDYPFCCYLWFRSSFLYLRKHKFGCQGPSLRFPWPVNQTKKPRVRHELSYSVFNHSTWPINRFEIDEIFFFDLLLLIFFGFLRFVRPKFFALTCGPPLLRMIRRLRRDPSVAYVIRTTWTMTCKRRRRRRRWKTIRKMQRHR